MLVGITAESYATTTALSPAVLRAVPEVMAEVLKECDRLGISYINKSQASACSPWWLPLEEHEQVNR